MSDLNTQAALTPVLAGRESVGTLCIQHFRDNPAMENRELELLHSLPPGQYQLHIGPQGDAVAVQEAWEAAGGDAGYQPTKAELLAFLQRLNKVCSAAEAALKQGPIAEVSDLNENTQYAELLPCSGTVEAGTQLYAGAAVVGVPRGWMLTADEVTLCHSAAVLARKHDGNDPSFTTLLAREFHQAIGEKLEGMSLQRAVAAPSQDHPDTHAFQNFHRSLCARFGYEHDPRDWRRDLVSLEEFIAGKFAAVALQGAPTGVKLLDDLPPEPKPWKTIEDGRGQPVQVYRQYDLRQYARQAKATVLGSCVSVHTIELPESNKPTTWAVFLCLGKDFSLGQCYQVYRNSIKGRSDYFADDLRHFLGQGPWANILDYDTDAPAATP